MATADTFTKKYLSGLGAGELLLVRLGVPEVLLTPLLLLYPLPVIVDPMFWFWLALAVPLELLAMILYVTAIQQNPLYATLPYLAFTPVFNVATAYILLGETVSSRGFVGILLVVLGAYLLNLPPAARLGLNKLSLLSLITPFTVLANQRGARIMLLVAAIYSVTSVISKKALQFATPQSFGAFYYALIGTVVITLAAFKRPGNFKLITRRPLPVLLVGALMGLMIVTHFLAIAKVEVAYMVAVKRTSLLFGMIYGAVLFREQSLASHFVAGMLMVGGAGLIVFS